jgi:hypothetical protein
LTISSVKRIISLIILSLIFSLCSLNFSNFAFAAGHQELYIHGESSQGGPIFHQAGSLGVLWAPGVEDSGTITIHNNYSQRIRVSNIGLTMDLQKQKGEVISNPELLESFAQNMELIIKKKVAGIFNDTIYRGTFWELLYQRDNPAKQGFNLPRLDKFNLGKGSSIELQYRVKMKESAGNQLQGIKATVSFLINASENQEIVGDDNSGDYEVNDYEGHWAQDCISTLLKQDILKPYADGTIRPNNYITRAEMAELICRSFKIEEKNKLFSGYLDPLPQRERGFIIAGTEKGILTGYPGKRFLPNRNISRQEMIIALVKAFSKTIDDSLELSFVDSNEIGDWSLPYVKTSLKQQIIVGYPDNSLRPKANMTRAETFAILCKLLDYHHEHS